MEPNLARTIRGLRTWEELARFEANARERNRLSDEIAAALNDRSVELGRVFIAEKTGLDLTTLSLAEEKIVRAVSEYVGVMRRQGKYPGRTLEQLRDRGLIGAAESAVCRSKPTVGFQNLADAALENLSYERIVVDHSEEFSPRAIWYSRRTLGLPVQGDSAPASTEGDTQTRTAALIGWLKARAKGNGGTIPPFTNENAAVAIGLGDTLRYGRVMGNIQSRIDFACYACGLPPLGLAAAVPYAHAWEQQDRAWGFPVARMQAAAQARRWLATDFDRVLIETERLPGQGHVVWKDALNVDEQRVKEWAESLAAQVADGQDEEVSGRRNPAWSRDELILALDLYIRNRTTPPGKDSPEVLELSDVLNRMGRVSGVGEAQTFRNANGVYMKMMNFRRLDPDYTREGKVGLTRGNKDDEAVWNEFSGDSARLIAVAAAIRSIVEQLKGQDEPLASEEFDIQEAEEGRILTRLHRTRERSRKLVDAKKKAALKVHGRLFCEACGFDYAKKYGRTGEGVIDIHHTKPVHTLVGSETTRLEDLALLCANCHRIVHSSRRWLTIEQVRELIQPAYAAERC